MAQNQIFELNDLDGACLKVVEIALNLDDKVFLLQIFETKEQEKKKYIRNQLILIDDILLTSTFSDTVHFLEELSLFDYGNDQNKYLDITEYKSTKNLKLKHSGDKNIFISKSKAKAMYKIFNMSLMGYSVASVFENEFRFTPQHLTQLLHHNNLLSQ